MTLPEDDDVEDVAREMVKELNRRFAMGDYGWLTEKRKRPTKRRRPTREPFGPWSDSWIESMKGQIGEHTWRSYKSAQRALKAQLGELRLDRVGTDHLLGLRKAWQQEGRKHRTINDRLGLRRMMFRDAKLSGVVASSPFDVPLPYTPN